MRIHLFRSDDVSRDLLDRTLALLAPHGEPMTFDAPQRSVALPRAPLPWEEMFAACHAFRQEERISSDDFVALLTSKANDKNWFSCPDPSGARALFVHTGDWDQYIADCPPETAVAFQIVECILQALMFTSFEEGMSAVHDPPVGCINDMCSWKPDITFKLRTADICGTCLERLERRGIPLELLAQCSNILEALRRDTLFKRRTLTPDLVAEDAIPFPVAITRRRLRLTSEPLRKFLFLIDHFDSLVRTSVLLIGNAVLRSDFLQFLRDQSLDRTPALGSWVSALKALSRIVAHRKLDLLHLPADLARRLEDVVAAASENHIVGLRNEMRGHGYCQCHDRAYSQTYERCRPVVAMIETLLLPALARLRIHHVLETARGPDDQWRIRTRPLMGSHPDFTEATISLNPRLPSDVPQTDRTHIYLETDGRWISMHPYLVFAHCPECRHNRVLLWEGAKRLFDPYGSHFVNC